ncbi:MAG: type VI secretion system baseplate subunit TssF [Deferribacterales bacterium]|nr:type VI secretion system baseplate subunit TssF [Deferribacterales bacterium]
MGRFCGVAVLANMKFLDYYRENLNHIRALGGEFASEFPKIASRLELSPINCRDPYVERLIEGTAFLAARVEKRIDDGFPRMLETLLSTISPRVLYPTPSVGIAELTPDYSWDGIKSGAVIDKQSRFEVQLQGTDALCIFRPIWETKIYPVSLSNAAYITRDINSVCPAGSNAVAALAVDFHSEGGSFISDCAPQWLDVFFNMSESNTSEFQQQLMVDLDKVYISSDNGAAEEVSDVSISIPALDGNNMAFGCDSHRLHGLGILQEFISHPAIFKFVRISGLDKAFKKCKAMNAKLIFTFKRRVQNFIFTVNTDSVKLWCVPIINVFPKRSSRERIGGNFEYHIVPERTAPGNYEVYSVEKVDFYNDDNKLLVSARSFYNSSKDYGVSGNCDYFSTHRRERLVSKNISLSSYQGSEVFITISGDNWHKKRDEITQFAAELLCTNGSLPLLLRADSPLETTDIKVLRSARFIGTPTKPTVPLISNGAVDSWEKIAHIMLNMSSILWQSGSVPLEILKRIIFHYSILPEEETAKITDGIKSIETEPETFRFIYKNCNVYFEKGWRIKILLAEQNYEGIGFFIFASVLHTLLNSFSAVNSCIEIVLYTEEKGFITKWITSRS